MHTPGARYQTGTKDSVLRYMVECAIRDRETLIECYAPPYPGAKQDDTALQVIADCKASISDFRKYLRAETRSV